MEMPAADKGVEVMKKSNELRKVEIVRNFTKVPAGSVLIKWGNTWVLCTASVSEKVPPFLKDTGTGWASAEYSILPASTPDRKDRDITKLFACQKKALAFSGACCAAVLALSLGILV